MNAQCRSQQGSDTGAVAHSRSAAHFEVEVGQAAEKVEIDLRILSATVRALLAERRRVLKADKAVTKKAEELRRLADKQFKAAQDY